MNRKAMHTNALSDRSVDARCEDDCVEIGVFDGEDCVDTIQLDGETALSLREALEDALLEAGIILRQSVNERKAAPQLLRALRDLVEIVNTASRPLPEYQRALKAIAKAEGWS